MIIFTDLILAFNSFYLLEKDYPEIKWPYQLPLLRRQKKLLLSQIFLVGIQHSKVFLLKNIDRCCKLNNNNIIIPVKKKNKLTLL